MTEDNLKISFRDKLMGFSESKAARVKSFRPGDLVIFYVPRESLISNKRVGKFIGLAEIKEESHKSSEPVWNNGLFPYRVRIELLSHDSCEIKPLIKALTFIKNKNSWGATFLGGIVKVPADDFEKIRKCIK
jgi:predicted RNA-binding protein